MERERTSVGLDVHARSVTACGIDGDTGAMVRVRLVPQPEAILDWLQELPGPVAVAYEAGPTGFGHRTSTSCCARGSSRPAAPPGPRRTTTGDAASAPVVQV